MPKTTGLNNYSDAHFTRPKVAQMIIEHYKPSGLVLEPFKGGGAFYDNLPRGTECELPIG